MLRLKDYYNLFHSGFLDMTFIIVSESVAAATDGGRRCAQLQERDTNPRALCHSAVGLFFHPTFDNDLLCRNRVWRLIRFRLASVLKDILRSVLFCRNKKTTPINQRRAQIESITEAIAMIRSWNYL